MTTIDDSKAFCAECRGLCEGYEYHDGVMPVLLSEADHALARLLGAGLTYADAGTTLGMSETTVYRRMQSENLRRAVDVERSLHVDRVVSLLSDAAIEAINALSQMLGGAETSEGARLRAANSILTHLARLRTWHQDRPTVPDRQRAATTALLMPDAVHRGRI